MEKTYTPAEIANILATYETMKERCRAAQHRYYERNSKAKKEYAAQYYQRKKEERVAAQREGPSDPVAIPIQTTPA
jgi:hypothetical protein